MATAQQTSSSSSDAQATPRKRPKPGERRIQILHTLAAMLEQPGAERITTAALAARLEVSAAVVMRSVPPFRQQGANVRRPDRIH